MVFICKFSFCEHSHRRYNPLTDEYILCSPHRAKRPWQGAEETVRVNQLPEYDPACHLCPGNKRANDRESNIKYVTTYVFLNDFPAVQLEQPEYSEDAENADHENARDVVALKNKLFKVSSVRGKCFVICYSPNHSLTLPLMAIQDIFQIVDTWQNLYIETKSEALSQNAPIEYLQIFENKGLAMGCSNPHPHGQAWCLDMIPTEVSQEISNMNKYKMKNGMHLLADYVKLEIKVRERLISENDTFIVVVPFWAVWPFETMVLAKTHLRSLEDFSQKHKHDLALILKNLTTKYDNLFETSFPYSMGLHQAPLVCNQSEKQASWFHMHFYPPLLRSATVKKFLVGFEMLGESQRDLTSEQAAARLNALNGHVHYTNY